MDDNEHDWCPANSISIRKKWRRPGVKVSEITIANCDTCGKSVRVYHMDCGGYHENKNGKYICKHQGKKCYHFYINKHKKPLLAEKISNLDKLYALIKKGT